MIDYSALTDDDLHKRYITGDAEAGNVLALRYRRMVRSCTRPYFLSGGDSEDLLQEGMIGLLSAMREYDPDGCASFRSFAELCVRRRIISAARSASRQKHAPLNEGVPLEELLSDEQKLRSSVPAVPSLRSVEEQILAQEQIEEYLSSSSRVLSAFENRILRDYLDGLSYAEIAHHCGRSEKSVDNAIQRIRKKLARHQPHFGDIS